MEDNIKEKDTEKYPKPVTIEGTKKILHQMENNICKIYTEKEKGTGFFVKISYGNHIIPVMMTNYHVLDEAYLKENKEIKITLSDKKNMSTIRLNGKRRIYCNQEYDTTIIEIKPEEDQIYDFMELDEDIFAEDSNLFYNNKSIYIIHYPSSEKVKVSYAIIKEIEESEISHYCSTEKGSSGSPIINLSNHKIIGIHKQGAKNFTINYGTYLKYPIKEFISKYIENNKIKINENVINTNRIKTIDKKVSQII